jgi:hypothetical protein
MKFRLFLCASALLVAAACAGGTHQSASADASAAPTATPTNTVDFPLFDGSAVIVSRNWQRTVSDKDVSGVFARGAGTYVGNEVIAETPAVLPALETWVHGLNAQPPNGYEVAVTGSGVEAARARANNLGIDFAVFQRTENGKTHGLLVMALDPQQIQSKAGALVSMIEKFKLLPQSLRDPIDAQTKRQTGFTLTEALAPDTPLGAALGALDALRDSDERGIVLLDAVKQ